MDEENNPRVPNAGADNVTVTVGEFPSEPFSCPVCGQMLAPSCRVCVACKNVIDPAKVGRGARAILTAGPPPSTSPGTEPIRYPWGILFIVVAAGLMLGLVFITIWGEQTGPLVLQTLPILVGLWVVFDASQRRVPRPWRWGAGTVLLLAFVFPWYLARRRRPQAPAPWLETVSLARILLVIALLVLLAAAIRNSIHYPGTTAVPAAPPKVQKPAGNSKIATLPACDTNLTSYAEHSRSHNPRDADMNSNVGATPEWLAHYL